MDKHIISIGHYIDPPAPHFVDLLMGNLAIVVVVVVSIAAIVNYCVRGFRNG